MTEIATPVQAKVPGTHYLNEIYDGNGHFLLRVFGAATTVREDAALAVEIAHRINLYPELVAALKALVREGGGHDDFEAATWEAARAVLAKAGQP